MISPSLSESESMIMIACVGMVDWALFRFFVRDVAVVLDLALFEDGLAVK